MILAIILLAAAGFGVTCNKEYNKDIFWHLACGKWMFEHGNVLDTDPFTAEPEAPGARWLNIHWGFQILATWLHNVGGFDAFSYAKAAVAILTLVVLVLGVCNSMGAGWLIFCGMLVLMACADRIRMRPEIFTLMYSMFTIVVIERVRQGASRLWLWALVPLMIVWANMHGLYIIGLALMWSAVLGAVIDRLRKRPELGGNLLTLRALLPVVVATAAVVATPWGVAGALHPLLLWTRISGDTNLYHYVSELMPVWQESLTSTYHALMKQVWALALTVLAGAAMITHSALARRTRISAVPVSHIIWLLAFFGLWMMAERNVILVVPVAGYLLALHGGRALRLFLDERPLLGGLGLRAVATALVLAGLVYISWDYGTERVYLRDRKPNQSGPGLLRQVYGVGLAQYMAKLEAPGAILCQDFGDAGPFLYYTYPTHLSWMDGRLEAHDYARFKQLVEFSVNMGPPPKPGPLKDAKVLETWQPPQSVRYVMVGPGSNVRDTMSILAQSPRFGLVCVDQGGAVFALKNYPAGGVVPVFGNRDEFDRPLEADGLVEGVGAVKRTWWRQNPFSLYDRMADIFTALGTVAPKSEAGKWSLTQQQCQLLAIRYRTGAMTEALDGADEAAAQLAVCLAIWAEQNLENPEPDPLRPAVEDVTPVDLDFARANYLLTHLDWDHAAMPAKPGQFTPAMGWVTMQLSLLVKARQYDAAARAHAEHVKRMPTWLRSNPPPQFVQKEQLVKESLANAEAAAKGDDVKALANSPVKKARLLAGPKGLIDRGIAELQKVSPSTPGVNLTLGDLLLRKGQPENAREKYRQAAADAATRPRAELGLALCDWVEGKYYPARDVLAKLAGIAPAAARVPAATSSPATVDADRALAIFYLAQMQEQLGLYEELSATLAALEKTRNAELIQKLQPLRLRHPWP